MPEISRVLIASITQLCSDDHEDDPAIIAAWTANKSEGGVIAMMSAPATELIVAERSGQVVAVGAITGHTITLNYVDPDHRRTGLSRMLLRGLEKQLAQRHVAVAHLKSTATAHAFYLSQGWVDAAPTARGRFITAFPMTKALCPTA